MSAHRRLLLAQRNAPSALLCALLLGCAHTPSGLNYTPPTLPEAASGYQAKPGWETHRFAVAAANPLATDAGYQVLKAGGSAVDAAIAVQLVLGLVEPQSSGIAGGAFLLHYDGHKQMEAFDGRETAPAAVDDKLFLNPDGKPMAFYDAVLSGRSVGTPGAIRMLEMAHRRHGQLPWAQLFEPAIKLAEAGFTVSPRLATLIKNDPHLKKDPSSAAFFYPDGQPIPAGTVLKNPAYAQVLHKIARTGSQGLHEGSVAQAIVNKVHAAPNPGQLSMSDLSNYRPLQREAFCTDYATPPSATAPTRHYRLCGMPPPSSGAITLAQILGILNHTPAHTLPLVTGPNAPQGPTPSADFLHLYTEASRLAFADRAQYIADPDFVQAPGGNWHQLLSPEYLRERAKLIDTSPQGVSMKLAKPGEPKGTSISHYAPMPEQLEYGTSHISIVDAKGRTVAMTTTIEDAFGSRRLTDGGTGQPGGFLLNNELTDFSLAPTNAEGQPIANRVQAGKRPRSSMAPTLVFEKSKDAADPGTLIASVGSPGGAMIIHFTAKTLYGMLNWGLNPQQAIDLPNFGSTNGPSLLEQNRFTPSTIEALKQRGAEVKEQDLTSGVQAIRKTPNGWFGGADPRREGIVRGN